MFLTAKALLCTETKDGTACKGVTCPALASKKCKAILPPGSCCPLCGGMIRVILSKTHLNAVVDSVWKGEGCLEILNVSIGLGFFILYNRFILHYKNM